MHLFKTPGMWQRIQISSVLALLVTCVSCVPAQQPTPYAMRAATPTSAQPAQFSILVSTPVSEGLQVIRAVDTGLSLYPGGFAWSHDGQQIVYSYGPGLWVTPVGRWGEKRQIHYFGPGDFPGGETLSSLYTTMMIWSPDDTQIGFTLERAASDRLIGTQLLAITDVKSGTVSTLSDVPAELWDWSNDNLIATHKDKKLYLYNPTTKKWIELPPEVQSAVALRFWESKRSLIATLRNGTAALVDIDTFHVTPLPHVWNGLSTTTALIDQVNAVIGSPNGRYIAWLSPKDHEITSHPCVITIYDTVTKEQRILLQAKMEVQTWSSLAWSPDGRQLAFAVHNPTLDGDDLHLVIVYLK